MKTLNQCTPFLILFDDLYPIQTLCLLFVRQLLFFLLRFLQNIRNWPFLSKAKAKPHIPLLIIFLVFRSFIQSIVLVIELDSFGCFFIYFQTMHHGSAFGVKIHIRMRCFIKVIHMFKGMEGDIIWVGVWFINIFT